MPRSDRTFTPTSHRPMPSKAIWIAPFVELAEAQRLAGDDRYSSIARLKALPLGYQGAAARIRALEDATYITGLRRAPRRMTTTRRLAAILAADVAGYSRLIGADEGGTLQALKAIRAELLDPTIAAHNGRLVKTTGDGLLCRVQQRGGCSSLCDRGAGWYGRPQCNCACGQAHLGKVSSASSPQHPSFPA